MRAAFASAVALSLACPAVPGAAPAHAADLPAQSRLGAIFAEPGPAVVAVERRELPMPWPEIGVALSVPGYYGRITDFTYSNYYGTSPVTIYERLPYACGFYGYC